jgi:hypothetical protein
MRMKSVRALLLTVGAMALAVTVSAQEGHPLAGTWYGDYSAGAQKVDLTVIMKWDGKAVTGMINPGPKPSTITAAAMDITPGKPAAQGQGSTSGTPPVFHVRFEADLPNAAGTNEHMVFEGVIQNPVAGNRTITGTWTRGSAKGNFQIRRL